MTVLPAVTSKLMNSDESIPQEFFIFVNKLNFITKHNFDLTKSFRSAAFASALLSEENLRKYAEGTLDFCPYQAQPLGDVFLSPYFMSAVTDYGIEYDSDCYRKHVNALYPSRLSAIYAFGDYASCLEVNRKWDWPLDRVYKFTIAPSPLNRVVKVNMEVVSLARHAYRVSSLQCIPEIWRHYWTGNGNLKLELPTPEGKRVAYDSGVIWEYLIEGNVNTDGIAL